MESILAERTDAEEKLLRISAQMDDFERYSSGHAARVAAIAGELGSLFNLASRDRSFLKQAALVHDIGEVSMNREYISSPRDLSASELLDLQRHPVIGEQMAAKLGLSRGVQLIIRWHHEWWDGSGYPDSLEGEQTPLAARILRVADTYASMTATRPFRQAISASEAERYLIEWAGIEFDPAVVKAFASVPRTEHSPAVHIHATQ